ncbi:MAG: DUF871 domain-containing protein [Mycoplasmatales bacterium]|nr:DUF871 domain-containing protein [Mycoplasmatales bacterium]
MNKLGISVYPEITGIKKTKDYIDLASKNGFNRIFMNLLEIDKNDDTKIKVLKEITKYARNKKFEVIVDVNPQVYEELSLPKNEIDFFANLEISGIRLDEDFGGKIEAELSNNKKYLKIELNASAGTSTIDNALKLGANPSNLIACHNFYPMEYTGLDRERFIELSSHYKAIGVRVAAFITLPTAQEDAVGPWNVNDGMPTIEEHRFMKLEEQVLDFLSTGLIDDIIISSQGATEEQFKAINKVFDNFKKLKNEEIIEIRIKFNQNITEVEKDIILNNKNKVHNNRPDYTAYFIRSTWPRITYKDEVIKAHDSSLELKLGDVIILNENLGRYKGEFHIAKKNFQDNVNGRNLVGKVIDEDLYKINFIKDGTKFKIIEVK